MLIGEIMVFNLNVVDPGLAEAAGQDVALRLIDLIGADLLLGGVHRLGGGNGVVLRQEAGQIAGGEGERVVTGVVGQHLLHHLAGGVHGGAHLKIVIRPAHGAAHRPPPDLGAGVAFAVPDRMYGAALAPVGAGHLGVEGPKGQIDALEFACLVGLLQPVGGKPAAFDPLGKILLRGLPVHPEGNYPVGRDPGLLTALQQLGGAAHGAHGGGTVLVHGDLCAAGTADNDGSVGEGDPLALPLGVPLKIVLLHPLYGGLRHIGRPAGGALQTLLCDIPFNGAAAVGAYLAVHFFLMFCLHILTYFRRRVPDGLRHIADYTLYPVTISTALWKGRTAGEIC